MLLSHYSSQINSVIFYCSPGATNTALSFKPWAIKNQCPNEGVAVPSSRLGNFRSPPRFLTVHPLGASATFVRLWKW